MFKLVLIVLGVAIIIYCIKNKVVIKFTTFFKKGFSLNKDVYGCYCFTGKQGSGKTLSAFTFIEQQNWSNKVVTNVKSYADRNKSYVVYEPNFYNIIQGFKTGIYDSNTIIFYDEIFTLLEKGKLDKSILSFISQLRKRGLILVTTAQEWLEINVTFRRYVRYQIDCSLLRVPIARFALSINKVNDGYNMAWDNLQNEYVAPRLKTTIQKCSLDIANKYDTYEVIKEC